MESTPLATVSADEVRTAKTDWEENYLLNTMKAAMTEAKRLGQYPIVWNHGLDSKCKEELESKNYEYTRVDKWQYLLYSKDDVDGKWLELYKKEGFRPHELDHVIPPAYIRERACAV